MARLCMVFGLIVLMAVAVVGGLTLGGSSPARADSLSPGLTIGTRFDRPVAGVAGESGDWIGSLTPLLLSDRLGPFTSWDFRAYRRYDTSPERSGLLATHDVALGTFSSQLAEHTRVSLDGTYYGSRDVLNADPLAAFSESDQMRASGAVGFEMARGEAGYRIDASQYTDSELADGHAHAWNMALYALSSEQNRWLLGWRREEWTVDTRTELASSMATAGLRRQHTPFLSSEVELGVASVADDRAGPARQEFAWVAGVKGLGHALNLPFDASFRMRHDVFTSGTAEISRPMPGARIALRWERSMHAGGGFFYEPTYRDFVEFQAQDTLGGRSILSLEASYRLERPRTIPQDKLETWRAAAACSRDLRPWLRARVRYSLAEQTASGDVASTDFDRTRLEFALSAVYQ